MRLRPTRRLGLVALVGLPVALFPAIMDESLWTLWLGVVLVAVAATLADLILVLPAKRLDVSVDVPDLLYMGGDAAAVVRLAAPGLRLRLPVEVLADLDLELEAQPPGRVVVTGREEAVHRVALVPKRRGMADVHAVWLRWPGPLGLISRTHTIAVDEAVAVVPDTKAVKATALRFFGSREQQVGLKVEKHIGDGSEFESLREYVPGLDHRSIDWKASARHCKLLVREFRAERNHQVVLALDTGHLMSEPIAALPKLDHAINAGLLLGFVCLKSGDRVGLFAFDEKARLFVEPRGGVQAMHAVQARTAELEYSQNETNFTLGIAELSTRLRRRSLVIVLTDFVDTVSAELMIENLDRLARRHVVVFVTLRDPNLDGIADAIPSTAGALHRAAVANDLIRERDVVLKRLQRSGVHCIDAIPERISSQLINSYLDIKRRELV